MRIKIEQADSGAWLITPLSGNFNGKVVAIADGISMRNVTFEGPIIFGEACAVHGLMPIDDMLFNDPATVKGLGLGHSFNMRDGDSLHIASGGYALEGGGYVTGAQTAWVLKDEVQVFGVYAPQTPAGYTAEELERDNPYNAWMHE